jgi:hypothetical protein
LAFDKERNKTVDTPQIRPGDHRLRSGSPSAGLRHAREYRLIIDLAEEPSRDRQTPAVNEIGSFHVGGRVLRLEGLPLRERVSTPGGPVHQVDPNGEIVAGQMYVQYVRLTEPKAAAPLLLWHGGGLTAATWETTPDGRLGWQMFFLHAGFHTYVSDAVERGRASFAPFPQIYAEVPYFRTAKEAWEDTFRFGSLAPSRVTPALTRRRKASASAWRVG